MGGSLEATVSIPTGTAAAIVTLHPANGGSRDYFLFRHLADVLGPLGVATLRFDRRDVEGLDDVWFDVQAEDAAVALTDLRDEVGDVPVGLWAFSQGTWPATMLASRHPNLVDLMILVGAPAISPADQMRYGAERALRAQGYGDDEVREMLTLRSTLERYLTGLGDLDALNNAIEVAAASNWFEIAQIPRLLGPDDRWHDANVDPTPFISTVRCPVLLIMGTQDEWVPTTHTVAMWERAASAQPSLELRVVLLEGIGHLPTTTGEPAPDLIPTRYSRELERWVAELIKRSG